LNGTNLFSKIFSFFTFPIAFVYGTCLLFYNWYAVSSIVYTFKWFAKLIAFVGFQNAYNQELLADSKPELK
jgi:hypothetical protein